VIDHRHALGDADRVVVGEDHDTEAEADALRQPAERAEQHLRARRHREAREEVVLDEPDGVEAHLVGEDALLQRLLDDPVIVHDRSLHLVGEAQSHALPPEWYCDTPW